MVCWLRGIDFINFAMDNVVKSRTLRIFPFPYLVQGVFQWKRVRILNEILEILAEKI